jgi:hypothetical protein
MKTLFIIVAAFLSGVISSICGISIVESPALYCIINIPIVILIVIIAEVIFPNRD